MLATIGQNIIECQELAMALGLDEEYGQIAGGSMARFVDLFEKGCQVPLTEENISFHAEIRGRMSERLRLTMELQSVKKQIQKLENKKSFFHNMLARIKEKGKESEQ